tara:strand:- start:3789 stop:4382 length:594 start_codon:yes stop_codon:yes gene_type:complete
MRVSKRQLLKIIREEAEASDEAGTVTVTTETDEDDDEDVTESFRRELRRIIRKEYRRGIHEARAGHAVGTGFAGWRPTDRPNFATSYSSEAKYADSRYQTHPKYRTHGRGTLAEVQGWADEYTLQSNESGALRTKARIDHGSVVVEFGHSMTLRLNGEDTFALSELLQSAAESLESEGREFITLRDPKALGLTEEDY